MPSIPPRSFYKLPKEEQENLAVAKMQQAYKEAEAWRKLSIQARSRKISDPENIDRPDEAILKA